MKKKLRLKKGIKKGLMIGACIIALIIFTILYTNRIERIENNEKSGEAVLVNFTR